MRASLRLRTIAALAICALLCACGGAFAAAKQSDIDAQIKQQEREFEKIQKQISQNQKKLTETAKREKSVANQLNKLSQRITVTQQRVNIRPGSRVIQQYSQRFCFRAVSSCLIHRQGS